jgi:PIN domain nuclease of toxin-antitoxin system
LVTTEVAGPTYHCDFCGGSSSNIGYELAYKQRLGRLPAAPVNLARLLLRERIEVLPNSLDHTLAAAALPGPRDPWDRIMMVQSLAENCRVVTIARVFSDYRIPVLW